MKGKFKKTRAKFIFVTGGVLSSLGKGLAAASIGALMESRGLKVTFQKLDPYINVDPGTMNPFQHGEVYVTDDGAETDLDLGHYERFGSTTMGEENNYTSGKIYYSVILKERHGDYLGGTVQVVPHITDEIKRAILSVADRYDIVIVEVGGTIGDIEGLPFLEAIRQFRLDIGKENAIYIHLTLVPYIKTAGELKTKPTQHSVKALREIGIQPDILLCRTDRFLPPELKRKVSLFCNVDEDAVITAKDVETVYEVPLVFHREGLDEKIVKLLNIWTREPRLEAWEELVYKIKHPNDEVKIGIVGKYTSLKESYKSLHEALTHGGVANDCRVLLKYIEAEEIEEGGAEPFLKDVDGVLVPGGFGKRATLGKIMTIEYSRKNMIPFFGICLGMQLATVEFARNVVGLNEADSTEFSPDIAHPVIYFMKEWYDSRRNKVQIRDEYTDKGGTMRLGAYPCILKRGTLAHSAYKQDEISERHRHRYEFNNKYRKPFLENGMVISGLSPDEELVEIIELKDHPWFLGCQFHPEFKSHPMSPHPLFSSFIKAALEYKHGKR